MTKEEKFEEIHYLIMHTPYLGEWKNDWGEEIIDAVEESDISYLDNGVENLLNKDFFSNYFDAIDFLREEDPSFIDGLEYADELGFSPKDLDTNMIANLYLVKKIRESWNDIRDKVEAILLEEED
jgi:hypothetical protein